MSQAKKSQTVGWTESQTVGQIESWTVDQTGTQAGTQTVDSEWAVQTDRSHMLWQPRARW